MVFPIADLRAFVTAAPRLSQPHWSDLMEDQDFMHFMGTVRGRINDGDDIGKAEESLTVQTRRGIQFATDGALHHQSPAVPSVFFCAYRRFYFDTHATAKKPGRSSLGRSLKLLSSRPARFERTFDDY